MTSTKYDKLIRDLIPEVLKKKNLLFKVEVLDEKTYIMKLDQKLEEEGNEYLKCSDEERLEELADIMEVIYAILDTLKITRDDFNKMRQKIDTSYQNDLLLLNKQLKEEIQKYQKVKEKEEKINCLLKITNIIYAILNVLNISSNELEELRRKKAEERGGFQKRLLLKEVIEN